MDENESVSVTDKSIDDMITHCANHAEEFYNPNDPEYTAIVDNIKTLSDVKQKNHISKETILRASVELIGLVLVLKHERIGIITSKAFGMLKRF